MSLLHATPVQAFAAGAALCSTSLGTTFTILSTSGLDKSRLGVILSSAAMLDDVAGLVMVQVISNLGASAGPFNAVTVIRPVFVSVAFAVLVPLLCWALVKPVTKYVFSQFADKIKEDPSKFSRWACTPAVAFSVHTLVLLALVTGSSYAGTSNLFAAYIAGAVINWWDTLVNSTLQERRDGSSKRSRGSKPRKTSSRNPNPAKASTSAPGAMSTAVQSPPPQVDQEERNEQAADRSKRSPHHQLTGATIYEHLFAPAVNTVLKPFFFVSLQLF